MTDQPTSESEPEFTLDELIDMLAKSLAKAVMSQRHFDVAIGAVDSDEDIPAPPPGFRAVRAEHRGITYDMHVPEGVTDEEARLISARSIDQAIADGVVKDQTKPEQTFKEFLDSDCECKVHAMVRAAVAKQN